MCQKKVRVIAREKERERENLSIDSSTWDTTGDQKNYYHH